MNLGIENETLEFKKTTGEIDKAVDNIASMLNKHGHGILYFGVSPNGDVTGQQISASSLDDVAKKIKEAIKPMIYPIVREEVLDGKKVIKVEFSGTEKPYSSYGRYYKRVFDRTEEMTPDELKHMMASTDYSSYWENNLTSFGVEAIDTDALNRFYMKSVSCGRLEPMVNYSPRELLIGLGLMENDKLTNAGYYLFSSKKPAVLKMAVYVTDERLNFSDIRRLEDNIYNLIEKAFEYVKEHMDWSVENDGGISRIEVPEIPVQALREIIVNSFAHADYRGITENEIDITPTQVEIYNPGEFPVNLTPEMFVSERVKSMPRNRVILNTLFKSKDVEMFGSGLKKAYSLCKASGNKIEYLNGNGGISFVVSRNKQNENVTINVTEDVTIKSGSSRMISTDFKVLEILKERPESTREEISGSIGKTVRTVQRALDKLEAFGKIVRIGSKKTGYWEVINK
ncbi:MAG: putative DNA binding domain-containing protein [Eubacteriales bacterium]|nr:putative DNA binding domain-containing protein [Eubacteriales bacterium]